MTKTRQEARTALGILAAHNLAQNLLLNERGYVTGNLAVSGLLVWVGRGAELSWEEMGLHPGDARKVLVMGARASATIGAVALLALSHPKTRSFLLDERAMAGTGREVLERTLIRFPVGTALFEEVAFRGVLPALLQQARGPAWAEAISATAFGLWHLIPTRRALSSNPLGESMPARRRAAVILGGSAVAGFAGLGFSWMKRETGSLLAPWLAHTSYNILSYLAAAAALRLERISRFPGHPWPDQPR